MNQKQPSVKYVCGFIVNGFTVRTQNKDECEDNKAKIPSLWHRFYAGNAVSESNIFGVYSDYETDENGFYNVTAGVVNDSQDKSLHSVQIRSGNYLVFQGKGTMPKVVIETWERVWHFFNGDNQYQRCFKTDYEVYSNGNEVAIYIGIQ